MKNNSPFRPCLIFLMIVMISSSCTESRFPGFEETESGSFYKEHVNGKDTTRPREGDVLTVKIIEKTQKDSIIFDSGKSPNPVVIRMLPPVYKGDFFEMISLMNLGDSFSIMLRIDSFFTKFEKKPIPKTLDSLGYLVFDIKLDSIKPKLVAEAELKKMQEERMAMMLKAKNEEPAMIEKYLTDNSITVKPTATGLYYIETQKGKGEIIKPGQMVSMKYTGKFFNGEVFDASDKHGGQPYTFPVGDMRSAIQGWHEAAMLMKPGAKATLIIPSSLAYGDMGYPPVIAPFTPLLFDVEVVDVK